MKLVNFTYPEGNFGGTELQDGWMSLSLQKPKYHERFAPQYHLFFIGALRRWRRGNIALITTLPVLDCLNSVQHLQRKCLEERFLRLQTRKKGAAKVQLHQHIISTFEQSRLY